MNEREKILRQKIKICVWFFIFGLVISGATAIPLLPELALLVRFFGADHATTGGGQWLVQIHGALTETQAHFPFLFYGTDWLAFGHFVIAIVFLGAVRDPVRNRWLFDFGLIACVLVIPYALVFGGLRGIPFWWWLIDCSFGVFGSIPLWFCRKWAMGLENQK